jgi:hypothetical protein
VPAWQWPTHSNDMSVSTHRRKLLGSLLPTTSYHMNPHDAPDNVPVAGAELKAWSTWSPFAWPSWLTRLGLPERDSGMALGLDMACWLPKRRKCTY